MIYITKEDKSLESTWLWDLAAWIVSPICSHSANHANSRSPHLMNGKKGERERRQQRWHESSPRALFAHSFLRVGRWKQTSFAANTTAGEGGSGRTIACSERVFNLYVLLEEVRNVYVTWGWLTATTWVRSATLMWCDVGILSVRKITSGCLLLCLCHCTLAAVVLTFQQVVVVVLVF